MGISAYLSLGHQRRWKSKAVFFPSKEQVLLSISKASYVATNDLQLIILLFSYSKCGTIGVSFSVHILRRWRSNLELQLYQLSCITSPKLLRFWLDPQARERSPEKMTHNVSLNINMCLRMKGLSVPASFALGCDLLCVSHLVLYATVLSLSPQPNKCYWFS